MIGAPAPIMERGALLSQVHLVPMVSVASCPRSPWARLAGALRPARVFPYPGWRRAPGRGFQRRALEPGMSVGTRQTPIMERGALLSQVHLVPTVSVGTSCGRSAPGAGLSLPRVARSAGEGVPTQSVGTRQALEPGKNQARPGKWVFPCHGWRGAPGKEFQRRALEPGTRWSQESLSQQGTPLHDWGRGPNIGEGPGVRWF